MRTKMLSTLLLVAAPIVGCASDSQAAQCETTLRAALATNPDLGGLTQEDTVTATYQSAEDWEGGVDVCWGSVDEQSGGCRDLVRFFDGPDQEWHLDSVNPGQCGE